MNTYDQITSRASEILDLLDDVSASLENTLLQFGSQMTPGDFAARTRRCQEARKLCDALLRSDPQPDEDDDA